MEETRPKEIQQSKDDFLKKLDVIQKRTTELRGSIVNATIQIETMIDAILSYYFAKRDKISDFLNLFLFDRNCSSNLKLSVLNRLPLSKDYNLIKKDLQDIFEIRNQAAHSKPQFSFTAPVIFSKNKKDGENLEVLNSDLHKLITKVNPVLYKELKSLMPVKEQYPIE